MTQITTTIQSAAGPWPDGIEQIIAQSVEQTLKTLGATTQDAELSILLTDDAQQADLNTQWREKSKSTNVLSFPQIEPFAPLVGLLGDISLAFETVEKEARQSDIAFDHHVAHLVVHGFLHIVGYDHERDETAEIMENMERTILARMGIDDPYGKDMPVTRHPNQIESEGNG